MKIFQVITRLNVGGAAVYAILLSSELQKRGHTVCLINGAAGKAEGEMTDYLNPDAIDFRQVRIPELRREVDPLNDLVAFYKLVRLFRSERPDVVHTHLSKSGFLGRLAALATGTPVIIHSLHGTVFNGYFEGVTAKVFLRLERFLGRRSSAILTDTSLVRQDVIANDIALAENVRVVALGLDLEQFRDVSAFKGVLRKHLRIGADVRIVGMIARLVPVKGVEYFLEAAANVLRRFDDVHFVVAGGGELKAELEKRARTLGIADRFTLLGFWRDLRELYADFRLLTLSSLSEGCPVAVLEGMAAGLPIVASAVGGVPDVVHDGVNGLLFPARDVDALTAALIELLENPRRAQALAAKGRAEVFESFTIAQSAAKTEAIYDEIVATSNLSGVAP